MKIMIAIFISLMPVETFRKLLYNYLFNYKIINSKIGFGTVIICKVFEAKNSKIGFFNFIRVTEANIEGSIIANLNIIKKFNKITCKNWSQIGSKNIINGSNFDSGILKMTRAQFTTGHLIYVNNTFILHEDVVFGGLNSIINHGSTKNNTYINNNVYFGTAVFLISGVSITNNVLIGSGSLIDRDIISSGLYISHELKKNL